MFNRFEGRSENGLSALKRIFRFLPLALGILTIVLFIYGVSYISEASIEEQHQSLEKAVSRDIAQCYAVEGMYPPSLEYLKSHYGLIYDEEIFFVDYQPIGSNIFPDVTIIRLKNN